jgi:hypothetical protein
LELGAWKLIHDDFLIIMDPTLIAILRQGKTTGLYVGEDLACWAMFLSDLETSLRSVDSPRNAIIQHMDENEDLHRILLSVVGLVWKGNPPALFDQVNKHPKFKKYNALHGAIEKQCQQIKEFLDVGSIRYKKTNQQLINSSRTIDDIICQKEDQLVQMQSQLADMKSHVTDNYDCLKSLVADYQMQWDLCNREQSNINREKGDALEAQIVPINNAVRLRLALPAETSLLVHRNVLWNDKLGEVDLLLQYVRVKEPEDLYVIIECKSRIHDVMAGYQQNGPDRAAEKTHLMLTGKWVLMPHKTITFVVTTYPDNDFNLPVESLVKRVISHKVKHQCSTQETYDYSRTIINSDRVAPLKWYLDGGYQHVIIIDSDEAMVKCFSEF